MPKRVHLAARVVEANLIHDVPPKYPPEAGRARIEGTVVLQDVIGKDGTVRDVRVESGLPLLVQAAIEAVKQWRYNPYLLNGEPVEVDSRITDSFGSCGRHEKMGCNLTLRPELESSTVILGPSPTKPVSKEARTAGLAWERLPDPKPQLMLEIVFPSGQEHIFYLGPHAPASRLKKSTYCTASGWN